MNAKTLTALFVLAVLSTSALWAVVHIDIPVGSVVHEDAVMSPAGVVYMKIETPDSQVINADCMFTDAIRTMCVNASPGEAVTGHIKCVSGYCSYTELRVIRLITGS